VSTVYESTNKVTVHKQQTKSTRLANNTTVYLLESILQLTNAAWQLRQRDKEDSFAGTLLT